jgi:hypothetical protein
MIEFLAEHELDIPEKIAQINYRSDIMKPRLGNALVIMNPGKEPANVSIEKPTEILSAGFEESKLKRVVDILLT